MVFLVGALACERSRVKYVQAEEVILFSVQSSRGSFGCGDSYGSVARSMKGDQQKRSRRASFRNADEGRLQKRLRSVTVTHTKTKRVDTSAGRCATLTSSMTMMDCLRSIS